MDISPTAQPQDLARGQNCCCSGDNTDNHPPPSISPDHVVEDNCCSSGDEIKQGRCCSGSDENFSEDCCKGSSEGPDVGDEVEGRGGCFGPVSSLPFVDRRGYDIDKEGKDQEIELRDGELLPVAFMVPLSDFH